MRIDPRLAGRVDATDELQEAFLEAQKRLSRYLENPGVPLFVWLRGVALDTLVHVQRRHFAGIRNVGQEVSLHFGAGSRSDPLPIATQLVADLTSPSHVAMRDEVAQRIKEALETMEEIDREVLTLRHFEQLSNDEVASVIGVKKAAASRRYMRALKRLREVLNSIPGLDFGG